MFIHTVLLYYYRYIGGKCLQYLSNPTRVLARCMPLLSFLRFGEFFLHGTLDTSRSTLPALRSTLPADPRPCSTLFPAWAGHRAPTLCYHPQIRRPDEVGHDPRVCVHPTLLPPKKNSCHLIWRSSTSSVVNLK
jgi:hypothetical protein